MNKTDKEYKAKYLKNITDIELSSTQKLVVGMVDSDSTSKSSQLKIGIQKFWRKGTDTEWLPGKGFLVDYDTASQLLEGLEKAVAILDRVPEKQPAQGWESVI